MITQVNSTNTKQYEDFFKKIKEVSSLNIGSLEEYFQNLLAISALEGGRFTRLPLDEPCFNIDANSRIIEVPSDFRKNGIGVKGDQVAEILYFKIARYYDTTDLADDSIEIFFEWKLKDEDYILPYYLKDIDSEPGNIIFGCPIDDRITANAGTVQVAVRFVEKITENNTTKLKYSLSTLPASLAINPGLDFDITVNVNNTLNDLIRSRFKNSEASSAQASEPVILLTNLDSNKIAYLISLDKDSNNKPMLYVSAISPNGTTEQMEYKLFKNGSLLSGIVGDFDYKLTGDTTRDLRKSYYIKNDENNYVLTTEPNFAEDSEEEIYEKIYKFNFDQINVAAGEYKIQVINVVGYDSDGEGTVDKVYTKSIFTNVVQLPSPKKPIANIANNTNLVFSENNTEFILEAQTNNWDGADVGAVLSYVWYKDNEILDGENTSVLKVIENEEEKNNTTDECKHSYQVVVKNSLHGEEAVSEPSASCIVSYMPSAFSDVAISADGSPKAGATVTAIYALINNSRSDEVIAKWYIDGQEYNNSNENSLIFTIPSTGDYRGLPLTCKLYNKYNEAQIEALQIPSITITAG